VQAPRQRRDPALLLHVRLSDGLPIIMYWISDVPSKMMKLAAYRVFPQVDGLPGLRMRAAARHGRWGRLTSQFGCPAGDQH
jgi:hypothetical protein